MFNHKIVFVDHNDQKKSKSFGEINRKTCNEKETILYLISKQERRSKLRKTKITHTCMIVFRFGYALMQISLSFRIFEKTLFKNSFFILKKNHD